jgi:hypothetical protein
LVKARKPSTISVLLREIAFTPLDQQLIDNAGLELDFVVMLVEAEHSTPND